MNIDDEFNLEQRSSEGAMQKLNNILNINDPRNLETIKELEAKRLLDDLDESYQRMKRMTELNGELTQLELIKRNHILDRVKSCLSSYREFLDNRRYSNASGSYKPPVNRKDQDVELQMREKKRELDDRFEKAGYEAKMMKKGAQHIGDILAKQEKKVASTEKAVRVVYF